MSLDLVRQLRVAWAIPCRSPHRLSLLPAIEARFTRESGARDFLPPSGRSLHLRPSARGAGCRVRGDSGRRAGYQITPNYDPMIAKLIVWGRIAPPPSGNWYGSRRL